MPKGLLFFFSVSYFEAFVPKDPNHTLFFKSGENYEAFLDRVIEGHKQKKGFRRFSFLRAWELLRDRSIIGGTKVQEASQKAHVDETPKKKKNNSALELAVQERKDLSRVAYEEQDAGKERERVADVLLANALLIEAGNAQREDIHIEVTMRIAAGKFCKTESS
jgi:type II secretory ATPase GspE/PulE/Tfp pilus assembly ATPase PilB-like protein